MSERERTVVLAPGPVHLHPSVLKAVEPAHHRTAGFRELVKGLEHSLKELLRTVNPVYMMTSSGTGAMEAAIANVTSPGTRVLVIEGGKFGKRWEELSRVYLCNVETLSFAPGSSFDIATIMESIDRADPEVIALNHVESSTGALFPLKEFCGSLPDRRPLLVVDAIASLGVEDLEMDSWGIDLAISAGQKALAAPPGISFMSMSSRAREISGKCPRPLYYFSVPRYQAGCRDGDTPFTPAIQAFQILKYSLDAQKKTGWQKIRERHRRSSMALTSAFQALGMSRLAKQPSSSVQAMKTPPGCDSSGLIQKLYERCGVLIAGGQGELKGKIIRTGYTGLYSGATLALAVRAVGEILAEDDFDTDIEQALTIMEPLMSQKDIF